MFQEDRVERYVREDTEIQDREVDKECIWAALNESQLCHPRPSTTDCGLLVDLNQTGSIYLHGSKCCDGYGWRS